MGRPSIDYADQKKVILKGLKLGLTREQIAKGLGLSIYSIRNRLKEMGLLDPVRQARGRKAKETLEKKGLRNV